MNDTNKTNDSRLIEQVQGLKGILNVAQVVVSSLELDEVLQNIFHLTDGGLPEGVKLELDLGAKAPILGYPAQLNQFLLGLIMHAARDITPAGTVTVSTRLIADQVQITVTDTGCGYEPEALRALFKPGFQSDTQRVRMDWEMITVQSIVDRHRGSLAAESVPGQGTTYVINLPVWSGNSEDLPEEEQG